jgi:hypothetical protein
MSSHRGAQVRLYRREEVPGDPAATYVDAYGRAPRTGVSRVLLAGFNDYDTTRQHLDALNVELRERIPHGRYVELICRDTSDAHAARVAKVLRAGGVHVVTARHAD